MDCVSSVSLERGNVASSGLFLVLMGSGDIGGLTCTYYRIVQKIMDKFQTNSDPIRSNQG
jgi:hypothetical protein